MHALLVAHASRHASFERLTRLYRPNPIPPLSGLVRHAPVSEKNQSIGGNGGSVGGGCDGGIGGGRRAKGPVLCALATLPAETRGPPGRAIFRPIFTVMLIIHTGHARDAVRTYTHAWFVIAGAIRPPFIM
jgi:hypothetical protein